MSEPTDPHALIGAYALDAVDDLERRAVERHLAGCADCRAELGRLRDAMAAYAATQARTPPVALREAVLTSVAAQAQRPGAPAGDTRTGATQKDADGGGPARHTRRWVLGSAAAAVAAGVVGVTWRAQQDDRPSLTDRVLADPAARRARARMGVTELTVVRSPREGRAVAIFEPMPADRPGSAHTLWLLDPGGGVRNAGQVPPGGGRTSATYLLQGDARTAAQVAVTLEPAGTHPDRPGSTPLVAVRLPA